MNMRSGAQIVVKTLETLGVDTLFGIPGIHNLDIYDALLESSIRHVTARHEQGAGFMADGYARSSAKVGVALVITGPGLTNIMTPMAQALHDSIPLVVISSQIPTKFLGQRTGFLHELQNSTMMARSAAKESRCVMSVNDIVLYLSEAFRLAQSGRPGPVHVEIPLDLLRQETSETEKMMTFPQSPELPHPSQKRVEQAVQVLQQATRPAIIVGGGACRAANTLTTLAERLGAVVVETCAGKGIVDERHPLCLGGRLHFPAVKESLNQADAIVAFGTEFSPTDLWTNAFVSQGTLIQVDLDPGNFLRNCRTDLGIVGDVEQIASLLLERFERPAPDMKTIQAEVVRLKTEAGAQLASVLGMGPEIIFMQKILDIVRDILPEDAIFSTDMTSPAYVALSEFPAYFPRTMLHPVGFGTLGYALPAAIGAKLVNPQKVICVLAGDGGFQFTLPELAVACQEQISLPVILWNDGGFGEIRRNEDARHPGQRIGVDHLNPDFQDLAAAYRIPGFLVKTATEFRTALNKALEHPSPTLIEIQPY